jgi:hypothetical protein
MVPEMLPPPTSEKLMFGVALGGVTPIRLPSVATLQVRQV